MAKCASCKVVVHTYMCFGCDSVHAQEEGVYIHKGTPVFCFLFCFFTFVVSAGEREHTFVPRLVSTLFTWCLGFEARVTGCHWNCQDPIPISRHILWRAHHDAGPLLAIQVLIVPAFFRPLFAYSFEQSRQGAHLHPGKGLTEIIDPHPSS